MILGLMIAAAVASSPNLGLEAGRCRTPENGPAFVVAVAGLRDRTGRLKLELYPANDADFLADDNVLVEQDKTFARVEVSPPSAGLVELCIRAPRPGRYALSLLHDRNSDRRFQASTDGIGFSGNPRLGWTKPRVSRVAIGVDEGIKRISIVMNYRHGLRMRPD